MKVIKNAKDLLQQIPFQIKVKLQLLAVVSINLNNKQNHAKLNLIWKIMDLLNIPNNF